MVPSKANPARNAILPAWSLKTFFTKEEGFSVFLGCSTSFGAGARISETFMLNPPASSIPRFLAL